MVDGGLWVPKDLSPVMQWSGGHLAAHVAEALHGGANLGVGEERRGAASQVTSASLGVVVRSHRGVLVAGDVEEQVLAQRSWSEVLYARRVRVVGDASLVLGGAERGAGVGNAVLGANLEVSHHLDALEPGGGDLLEVGVLLIGGSGFGR